MSYRIYRDYKKFWKFLNKGKSEYIVFETDVMGWINSGKYQKEGLVCYPVMIERLLQTKAVKRLSRIFQLGTKIFCELDLTATRLDHSKGTYVKAQDMLMSICEDDKIRKLIEENGYQDYVKAELLRALLHDIGHGPFSHTMETICNLPKGFHEDIGNRIIQEDEEIKEVLGEKLIRDMREVEEKNFLGLNSLFEGQIDVDRGDFLPRDDFYARKNIARSREKDIQTIVVEMLDSLYYGLMVDNENMDSDDRLILSDEDKSFLEEICKIKESTQKRYEENFEIFRLKDQEELKKKMTQIGRSLFNKNDNEDINLEEYGIIADVSKNSLYKDKKGEEIYVYGKNGEIYKYNEHPERKNQLEEFENVIIIIDKKLLNRKLGVYNQEKLHNIKTILEDKEQER